MINLAMERKIQEGECIDLLDKCQIFKENNGTPIVFELNPDIQDIMSVDYCYSPQELWIWSIGRNKATGKIYAAIDGRFYMNDKYECLWLR